MINSLRFSLSNGLKTNVSVMRSLSAAIDLDGINISSDKAVARKERHTTYKFVDKVQIECNGGRGGNGCVSFEVLAPGKKRPNGGNGGAGGNVYLVGDKNLTSFTFQTFHFNGGTGGNGGSDGLKGRRGTDVYVKVPCGTLVTERLSDDFYYSHPQFTMDSINEDAKEMDDDLENETDSDGSDSSLEEDSESSISDDSSSDDDEEESEDEEGSNGEVSSGESEEPEFAKKDDSAKTQITLSEMLRAQAAGVESNKNYPKSSAERNTKPIVLDIDLPDIPVLMSEGGAPGLGNKAFSGSQTKRSRSLPKTKIPGRTGEMKSLLLELKLIADVGLVGFPNAGKSSLLRALSNAKPKVAAYAFTTLHPNVGVVEYTDSERITIADIPGLIEGAHENRGLGHDFLRHIVRTKVLLFVIDGAGTEGRDPSEDLYCLLNELEQYDRSLLDKPKLVFSNKVDVKGAKVKRRHLAQTVQSLGMTLMEGSALAGDGMAQLAEELRNNITFPIE